MQEVTETTWACAALSPRRLCQPFKVRCRQPAAPFEVRHDRVRGRIRSAEDGPAGTVFRQVLIDQADGAEPFAVEEVIRHQPFKVAGIGEDLCPDAKVCGAISAAIPADGADPVRWPQPLDVEGCDELSRAAKPEVIGA